MEKPIDEMDLDDWEVLSDEGFQEEVGKGVMVSPEIDLNPKGVFNMYYFTDSFDASRGAIVSNEAKQVVPDPIFLDTKCFDEEVVKEVINVPILEQVSFKKENEFVDTKMGSPKSGSRGVKIQVEAEPIRFEEEKKDVSIEKEDLVVETKEIIKWEKHGGSLNIWRWRLTGIGALCSIGMAAASICIFILGNQQRHKHQQQNQKLRFQIYADDKRFKQVVHHATKLNQAISSVRSGPFSNAHFTYGGYYVFDGL